MKQVCAGLLSLVISLASVASAYAVDENVHFLMAGLVGLIQKASEIEEEANAEFKAGDKTGGCKSLNAEHEAVTASLRTVDEIYTAVLNDKKLSRSDRKESLANVKAGRPQFVEKLADVQTQIDQNCK